MGLSWLYCTRRTATACRAPRVKSAAGVHGLLHSSQSLGAAVRAISPSLVAHLRKHRAVTRLALAGLALAVALRVSLQDAAAGNPRPNPSSISILPESVGTGVLTTD